MSELASFTDAERRMLDLFEKTEKTLPDNCFAVGAALEFARLLVKFAPLLDEREMGTLVVIGAMISQRAVLEATAEMQATAIIQKARRP